MLSHKVGTPVSSFFKQHNLQQPNAGNSLSKKISFISKRVDIFCLTLTPGQFFTAFRERKGEREKNCTGDWESNPQRKEVPPN